MFEKKITLPSKDRASVLLLLFLSRVFEFPDLGLTFEGHPMFQDDVFRKSKECLLYARPVLGAGLLAEDCGLSLGDGEVVAPLAFEAGRVGSRGIQCGQVGGAVLSAGAKGVAADGTVAGGTEEAVSSGAEGLRAGRARADQVDAVTGAHGRGR